MKDIRGNVTSEEKSIENQPRQMVYQTKEDYKQE